MAKLNYVKLNHGLNIYCNFLNFICQMYLNIILASKTVWFYFIGIFFRKCKFD